MGSAAAVTSRLLFDAWAALDGNPELLELVTVTGDDEGLLPSSEPALPAMLAAVAASTLAASSLDAARRKSAPEPVVIDAVHVALAGRSERYAHVAGTQPADPFAPLSRFWRTADGWLRLHANYSWHRGRTLGVLDCDATPEAVREAILRWRGEDLEAALAASGALGYAVRTAEEWCAHPQGAAPGRVDGPDHDLSRPTRLAWPVGVDPVALQSWRIVSGERRSAEVPAT